MNSTINMIMREHFDKLLVFCAMCITGCIVIYLVNAHVDKDAVTWAMRGYDNLQGSFITLLTGGAARMALDYYANEKATKDVAAPPPAPPAKTNSK